MYNHSYEMEAKMSSESRRISRRSFLQGAAMSGAGLLLAACQPAAAPAPTATAATAAETEAEEEAPAEETAEEEAPAEAPAEETVTISFLTQGGDEAAFQRYEPLIAQFQDAGSNVVVEPVWEPGGAIEIQTKLLTLIAAGDAPDVYWAHSYTNSGQAKRSIQLDLTSYIDGDPAVAEEDFLPAAWADFSIEGKQIGFPRETTSTILIYNKSIFDDNGVETPTDEWTWADFEAAAEALTMGDGPEKIYGAADFNLNRNTWIKLWQKGGDVLNEDRTEYIMNNTIGVEQVNLLKDWHQSFHIPGAEMGGFTTAELFVAGRVAMFPQFSVYTNIKPAEFEWDIAHLPVDSGDSRTTRVASAGHSVYSGTDTPDAAWKWISFLVSEDAFWHFVDSGLSLPSLRAVATSEKFLDPTLMPDNAQAMIDAFDYGRPEPVAGDWIGVHREVQPALDSIYGIEQAEAQAALDAIAERVNELIAYVPEA
jgi:multiple sugar transport system substrate-binding protein